MKCWFLVLVVVAAACTKHNPDVCCITTEQCDRLGLDEMFACDSARVCDPSGTCVTPQCNTAADCTSSDAPACVGQVCVAACITNDDCVGAAGPLCAPDGACVNCIDSSQCTADAPTCDATSRSCRKCELDGECASGVCLESAGTCAQPSQIIYLRSDGTNAGNCDAVAPCATFAYAFTKFSAQRNVIRIPNGSFTVPSAGVDLSTHTGFVDGASTEIVGASSNPSFTMGLGSMTLSGLNINNGIGGTALSVTGGAIYIVNSTTTGMGVTGGVLDVTRAKGGGISCGVNSMLTVRDSDVSAVSGTDCTLTVQRNRLKGVSANGTGLITIENNIITRNNELDDGPILNGAAGSVFRFNTLVNTSGVDGTATALSCNSGVVATSNIIAWHTSASTQCPSRYTLFDSIAGTQSGTGNKSADVSTVFVDPLGDFHLQANSPARGAAEPNLNVSDDIDGSPRPNPTGTPADVGAYEAP